MTNRLRTAISRMMKMRIFSTRKIFAGSGKMPLSSQDDVLFKEFIGFAFFVDSLKIK
jgi:hypothetical protein